MASNHSYRTRSTDRKPATVFVRTIKARRMQQPLNQLSTFTQLNPRLGPIHVVTRRQALNTSTKSSLTPPISNRLLSPSGALGTRRPKSALSSLKRVSPRTEAKNTTEGTVATKEAPMKEAVKETAPTEELEVIEGGDAKKVDPRVAPREKVVVIREDDSGATDPQEDKDQMLLQHQTTNNSTLNSGLLSEQLDQDGPDRRDFAGSHLDRAPVSDLPTQSLPILTLKRASPASNSTLSGEATPNKKSREGSIEGLNEEEDTLASAAQFDSSGGSTAIQFSSHHNIQNFSCDTCKLDFTSARMLQQHNQQFHADKNYVCEICSKAFRFRSNLAEHRSVHTALKPFVCKFCGKSSRLKGNLTKHILKHHKVEQRDYIGTDEIIIKKGKKSVKDPMAIEFLEKSMIVMTPTQAQSPGMFNTSQTNGGGNSSRHSTSNLSASDGSMTPLNVRKPENVGLDERCFLMSLGLDSGSLDLKAESSESDSSIGGGGSSTTNDQLLEKCNLFMDTHQQPTNEDEEINEHEMEEEEGEETPMNSSQIGSAAGALLFNALQQSLNGKTNRNGWAQQKTPQRPSFLDGLAAELSRDQQQKLHKQNGATVSATNGAKATTCPECGKHVRKPRDLITHLATIHGIAPSAHLTNPAPQSNGQRIEGNGAGVQTDLLRQLLQLVLELKSTNAQTNKLEQLITTIDGRVGRLEKQLEMALNSVYTLVQLQTGINSQLSRFKEETNEQLKTIAHEISQQRE